MEATSTRHRRRREAQGRALRRTALLAVFVVLGAGAGFLVAPLADPSARADSTSGVDVLVNGEATHVEIHADQYNSGPTKYILRSRDEQSRVTLSGVSLTQFIRNAGADVSKTNLVQVRREDGTWVNLKPPDFADEGDLSFREGPALFYDDEGSAAFFRPVRDLEDTNAYDAVTAADGTALLVRISSPGYLYVDATADPEAVQIRHLVDFRSVAFGGMEGEHLTYTWHFGDDATADGRDAAHRYEAEGEYRAWVAVVGDQDSRGHSRAIKITVTVDKPSPTPSPTPSPSDSTSPSPTTCPSPSTTASPTASPSPSATASPTASPSPSGAVCPSPSGTASPTPTYTTYSPPPYTYNPPPYSPPPPYTPPPPKPTHKPHKPPSPTPSPAPVATGPTPTLVSGFLVAGPGGAPIPTISPVAPATSGPESGGSSGDGSSDDGSAGRVAFAVAGGLLGAALFGLGVARELPKPPPAPSGGAGSGATGAAGAGGPGRRRRKKGSP